MVLAVVGEDGDPMDTLGGRLQESVKEVRQWPTDTEEDSASGVLLRHGPMSVAAVVGCHDAGILAYGEELLIPQLLPTGRHRPAGTNSGS